MKQSIVKTFAATASGLAVALSSGFASGQNYPVRPVRIITSDAGGGGDVVARIVAPGLSAGLGQSVIVDNRSGVVAVEAAAKTAPDGYNLLIFGNSLWIGPLLQKLDYDAQRDFAPITVLAKSPNVLVVPASLPVKSVKDLIAMAKTSPGTLNYASAGVGSASHLAGELFKQMAGVNIVRVPYKGVGPALAGVASGDVQVMFSVANAVTPLVSSGKLKSIAVTSLQPSTLAPGLPTITTDLPGYQAESSFGLLAPAKTPSAIVDQLNRETVKFLNAPATKDKFFNTGSEVVANSPEAFAAIIKSEITVYGKLIKDTGMHVE